MPRDPIPSWYFALVVVRQGDRFLLVQERKHGQLWYLPAGRAELGESLAEAARRETLEESGLDVRLVGLLRLEHSPYPKHARVRAVFLAEPVAGAQLKQEADDETLAAKWVTLDELPDYPLRGAEVQELFRYVAEGGAAYPLSLLQAEGAPYAHG